MKHIKLFENWDAPTEEEAVPLAWAEFEGTPPSPEELNSYNLSADEEMRAESGFVLTGKIEDLEAYSSETGNMIVKQGIKD